MIETLKHIDRVYFSVNLLPEGIIHVRVKIDEEITLEQTKEMIDCIGEIAEGRKYPVLVSSRNYSAPTAEARAFLAKKESNPYASAAAYIVKSLPERIVMNAFLQFNKPARPTRMFTSEKKAIEWLKTFYA